MLNNLDNETYDMSFEVELDWVFNVMKHLVTPNREGGGNHYINLLSNFFPHFKLFTKYPKREKYSHY